MKSTLNTIKNNFPDRSMDLGESLELLNEVINSTINDIAKYTNDSFAERDFDKVTELTKLADKISGYEENIDNIIDFLNNNDKNNKEESQTKANIKSNAPIDYDLYKVDNTIEHSLNENFKHIRPYGFRFPDSKIVRADSWNNVLIKMCELLMRINEDKFLSFIDNPDMNGRKRKYFSYTEGQMTRPGLISDLVYVELNLSSNSIRKLIISMLKEYNIDPDRLKIYFSHDYNDLHK